MSPPPMTVEVFPWNPNFETGQTLIDTQHRELVDMLNHLAGTLTRNDTGEILRVFEELAHYAALHFETEEAIWARYFAADDPWFVAHQQNHDAFLPAVEEMKNRSRSEPLVAVVEDVVKFLIRWLAFHIVDEDRRMALAVAQLDKGHGLAEAKRRAEKKMSGSVRVLVETVMSMYDSLSSRTLELLRERLERQRVEEALRQLNEQLEAQSITDALTGLYNRRHFDRVLQQELKRCVRERRPLSLLLLDIDDFKKLNDHYGHVRGDEVLQQVAKALQGVCHRPADFCFRVGGEEFAILIENPEPEAARHFAEWVRAAVFDLNLAHCRNRAADRVTVSVGAVSHCPEQTDTTDAFLRAVDVQLYVAKDAGRNRVAFQAGPLKFE